MRTIHAIDLNYTFQHGLNKIPVIELILGPGQRVNHEVYRCHGANPKSHGGVWKVWKLLFFDCGVFVDSYESFNGENLRV